MDRRTIDAYEAMGAGYGSRSNWADRAASLVEELPPGAVRADLGCGPGEYLSSLGRPVLALDATTAMLQRVPTDAWRVQADLEALPLRRGSMAAAWASKSYQHLSPERLPMALADLHRSLAVGAPVDLTVFGGSGVHRLDDDRLFAHWTPEALADLAVGAGFDEVELRLEPGAEQAYPHLFLRARRARTLADTVGAGMRVLVCGLNPSVYAADAGVAFARPGNRFWPAAVKAGLVTDGLDPVQALRVDGVGMTDLVKRASPGAAELTTEEFRAGLARLERLCSWLQPGLVCFVGLAGWRAAVDRAAVAGTQEGRLGGVPVYLAPSTSGRNASSRLDDLVEHLRVAAAMGMSGMRG